MPAAPASAPTTDRKPLGIKALRGLWLSMLGIYGHRWQSMHGDLPVDDSGHLTRAGGLWAAALAGIPLTTLKHGIEKCAKGADEWPPTLPLFRQLCLDIPRTLTVIAELQRPSETWSPFVRLVWSHVDRTLFLRAPIDQARRMAREAYLLAVDHVLAGGALPDPIAGVLTHEAPQRTRASAATEAAAMQAIAALFNREETP